ncbi:MAG: hypothetical protein WC495_04945 [Patescibacteria group bacterium]|jgi:D-hexose-6-phosphate mutarotase
MNGKLRHIERRKAAKEKEQEKWGEFHTNQEKVRRAIDCVYILQQHGVNVKDSLAKRGIDVTDAINYTDNMLEALEEMVTSLEG